MKSKDILYRGICMLFICFYFPAHSQTSNVFRYEYDLGSSGSGYDSGEGGAGYNSADGTYYITGITDNTVPFADDPLLMKINSNGTVNFAKQYKFAGNISYEVISCGRLTADGGYLIYGTTDFTNAGDILLIKTTSSGAFSWARELNVAGATFSPSRFTEKSGGGYILAGTVNGVGAGSSDAYLISISSDGNTIQFANAYGGIRAQSAASVIQHSSGKIALAGSSNMTGSGSGTNQDGLWLEVNSDGSFSNAKTLGRSTNNEAYKDLIETTAGKYLLLGSWCSTGGSCTGYPCSGSLVELNTDGSESFKKVFYTTAPGSLVMSPSSIYRTPDNNNYWIGGQIDMNDNPGPSANNNALVIRTSAAAPSPSGGYSIGDADEQSFSLSTGAVKGNDEFVLGGTENIGSGTEWRATILKAHSSLQCNSTDLTFATCDWSLTSGAAYATTTTALTVTSYTLTGISITVAVPTTTASQDCYTVLPVSLRSFSGKAEDNSVKLSWSTVSEENNNYFTIERSENGKIFSEIGNMNGAGTSHTKQFYDFADEYPMEQNYYRLSQTDFNGARTDLGIVAVTFTHSSDGLSLLVQSNPVSVGNVSLSLFSSRDEEVSLRVTDLQGRTLHEQKPYLNKNESSFISIDLKGVSGGIYFLSATTRNSSVNTRFLLLNAE